MRKRFAASWYRSGGAVDSEEGFFSFYLRACRALEQGFLAGGQGPLADSVRRYLGLLGAAECMDELDKPRGNERGLADHQIFPIPPMSCNGRLVRRGEAAGDYTDLLLHGGNLVISIFNWMHGGQAQSSRDVRRLSAAHKRIHARIARVLQDLVMTDDPILSHGGLDSFLRQSQLYSGCGAVLALGERGGVPELAADVPLADNLDALDDRLAAQVRDPKLLLLPSAKRPRRLKKGYTWVASSYPQLVKRNVQAGLHRYKKRSQVAKHRGNLVLAVAFAVAKDDKEDRVITDPSVNQLLDPSKLPRPRFAYIPSLRCVTVPSRGAVVVTKRDARHYFHRLQIGKKWHRWLCGPSVQVASRGGELRELYPASRAAPMGFGPSAGWAQALTDLVAKDANLPPEQRLHPDGVVPETLPVWGSIVDDIWALDHVDDEDDCNPTGPKWLDAAEQAWVQRGVQPNVKKSVNAALGVEVQGYFVHPHQHWVGLSMEKRRHLFQASMQVLLQRRVHLKVFDRVVGKHSFMHSARPCLRCVFEATYGWLDKQRSFRSGRHFVELPPDIWTELLVSTLLIPFSQFGLSDAWSQRVEATDSSMTGLGRAMSIMPLHVVRTLARYSATKGVYTNLTLPWGMALKEPGKCPFHKVRLPSKRVKWRTMGVKWTPKHITIGEGDAAVWSAHDRLLRPSDDDNRFIHPLDSAAMVGAFTKGRSSSRAINHRCKQMASINLCGGHTPFYIWVPSAENPADDPSRMFEPQPRPTEEEAESRTDVVDLRSLDCWATDATFFIHLCSGPRRQFDLLDCVERCATAFGYNIVGVAVDPMALAKQSTHWRTDVSRELDGDYVAYGDLLNADVGKCLLGLIHSGRVSGGFASPPCSTISAARHMPLNRQGGPRPLRDRRRPWEQLAYCNEREIHAVQLGTALFLVCLGMLGEIRIEGGWTGLEHPADRGDPFPSFFSTPEVAITKLFCRLRYYVLHQCMFGATTKKPTGLLIPSCSSDMIVRCKHSRRHPQLRGLDSTGNFLTTAAARYPPGLCEALARVFVRQFRIAKQHSYDRPFCPLSIPMQSFGSPWNNSTHVRWQWPEPRSEFLAEHLACLNSTEVHQGTRIPQQ
jgi:hypothetical protein